MRWIYELAPDIDELQNTGICRLLGLLADAANSVIKLADFEMEQIMSLDKPQTLALLKELADSPKRDNSAYHQALSEARAAFEAAEIALGGPVTVITKVKHKKNGEYVVKWVFQRNTNS